MTFDEAKQCLLSPTCAGCKYNSTDDNCLETARQMGAVAIDYMLLKQKEQEQKK